MSISEQKFRELVLQLLFSGDFSQGREPETGEMLMKQLAVTKSTLRVAVARAQKMEEKFPEIDRKVAFFSREYEFNRIPGVERSILRLAMYELLHDKAIPAKVAIAEAVRLARKFATPEASSFVNAVLDTALRNATTSSSSDS